MASDRIFKVCVTAALVALLVHAVLQANINHTQFKINQATIEGRAIQLKINDSLLRKGSYGKY